MFVNDEMTHYEASKVCYDYHGTLAMPDDKDELHHMLDEFHAHKKDFAVTVWMGFYNLVGDDEFIKVDKGLNNNLTLSFVSRSI